MIRTLSNLARLTRMARILADHDALVPHEYANRAPPSLRLLARVLGRRHARTTNARPA